MSRQIRLQLQTPAGQIPAVVGGPGHIQQCPGSGPHPVGGDSCPVALDPLAGAGQVRFAAQVRDEADIATEAVGLITDADQAEAIIATGEADALFLGRVLLRNPAWVREAADHLGAALPHPPQYTRAFR